MPFDVTEAFLSTLSQSDQVRVVSAEIWNNETRLAYLGTVTAGSANVDITQQVRRTCSATIESQGLFVDDLVPTTGGGLLSGSTGNELRLFRGFRYPDGTQELCPIGVFRMTKPVVTDTGENITIAVTGNDRAALVTSQSWTDVYTIKAGTPLNVAIRDLINDRIGSLVDVTYLFESTMGLSVPATTFGTDLAGSNDPMADAVSLATAASMELFFNETGALVLQPVPNPLVTVTNPIPETVSFSNPPIYSEGENCSVTGQFQRLLDETTAYNGVKVIGNGTGGAPVSAEVWDTDPTSATYYLGPWGKRPYIYQTSIVPSPGSTPSSAYAQCLSIAQSLYLKVHTLLDTVTLSVVPNPALLESDVIYIKRARIGISGYYTISQMMIPMDTATAMTLTARPTKGAAAVAPAPVPPVPPAPTEYDTIVIAGGGTHTAAYSTDGAATWTTLPNPIDGGTALGAAFGNGLLMLLGGAVVATIPVSDLGGSWTTSEPFAEGGPYAAMYIGSQWILCGTTDGHVIVTSPDGHTWTPQSSGLDQTDASYPSYYADGYGIAANSTTVMIVGFNYPADTACVVTSPIASGTEWTTRTTPFDGGQCRSVTWDEATSCWVVVGVNEGNTHVVMTNSNEDGSGEWTVVSTPLDSGVLEGVSSNGILAVAVGFAGGHSIIVSSNPSSSWTYEPSGFDAESAYCVLWDDLHDFWLVGGSAGSGHTLGIAPDGTSWTLSSTPLTSIYGLAVGTIPI